MNTDIIFSMLPLTMIYATPIFIAALGGLMSERSGIVNIALEGIMMIGGFIAGTFVIVLTPYMGATSFGTDMIPVLSILLATLFGALFSVIHAFVCINLKADQVISGTAINLLAAGITVFFTQIFFDQKRTPSFTNGFIKTTYEGLSDIPIIGKIFFTNIYYTVYIGFALVFIIWFIVYKTRFGLRLRASGENPHALASTGVSVVKVRYIGVISSGALAGLAGGIMILTQDTQFTALSVHGTGFIALAALIFGKWNPFGVLAASLFFAFSQVLAIFATDISFLSSFPSELFAALPYILTIVALVIFSGKSAGPKAVGEIYDVGKR